jgi:aspartokinase
VTRGLAHTVAKFDEDADRAQCIRQVFLALANRKVPIFLIKLHSRAVTFAVEEVRVPDVEQCLSSLALTCKVRRDLAQISIIASRMRDLTGIMVDIADSFQAAGARLYGVGDSHNSVQCLIDGSNAENAVGKLREAFGLGENA